MNLSKRSPDDTSGFPGNEADALEESKKPTLKREKLGMQHPELSVDQNSVSL